MAQAETKMYADSIIGKVDRIVSCLKSRSTEEINFRPSVHETNSLLVLAVHTMGNVNQALFEVLLGESVDRDRDAEFAATGSSADEIEQKWQELQSRIRPAIEGLTDVQLSATYDGGRRGEHSGRGILLITATHAAEHVGHAELTRDWLDSLKGDD